MAMGFHVKVEEIALSDGTSVHVVELLAPPYKGKRRRMEVAALDFSAADKMADMFVEAINSFGSSDAERTDQ